MTQPENAKDILSRRLAAGEISADEYDALLRRIEGRAPQAVPSPPPPAETPAVAGRPPSVGWKSTLVVLLVYFVIGFAVLMAITVHRDADTPARCVGFLLGGLIFAMPLSMFLRWKWPRLTRMALPLSLGAIVVLMTVQSLSGQLGNDPHYDSPKERIEGALFTQFPHFRKLAAIDPALWQRYMGPILATATEEAAPDGSLTDVQKKKLIDATTSLNAELSAGAARGTDQPLAAYLQAASKVEQILQRENIVQCAALVTGRDFDPFAYSPDARALGSEMGAALVDAYGEGMKTAATKPDSDAVAGYMREALLQGPAPFSEEELKQFSSLAAGDPTKNCEIGVKYFQDLASLPTTKSAAVFRAIFLPKTQ
ncbi:MAG: hypothetical protein KGI75_07775 [Rhizobiaceae bacterium]|nr:hypothetical protein [Rhizobiaceae bacterium]